MASVGCESRDSESGDSCFSLKGYIPLHLHGPRMTDLLANPIWHSLSTRHSHLAVGDGLAKRYPEEIGPLAGFAEQSEEGWDALGRLISPGGYVVVFLNEEPVLPADLKSVTEFPLDQMVCERPSFANVDSVGIEPLGEADVPSMVALAQLTEPGPFREGTIGLGGYRGIRDGSALVSMGGQRTTVPGYREVSAVCTHPNYRGRGYAAALVKAVSCGIGELGEFPYLHVKRDNVGAAGVYERLGYRVTRTFHCVAVVRNGSGG